MKQQMRKNAAQAVSFAFAVSFTVMLLSCMPPFSGEQKVNAAPGQEAAEETVLSGISLMGENSFAYLLYPAFDPAVIEYKAGVPAGISLVSAFAEPAADRVKIFANIPASRNVSYLFNGSAWESGDKSIPAGGGVITIRAAAGMGSYKDYRIVIRRSSAAQLPQITAFSFARADNSQLSSLSADISGVVDQNARTVTLAFPHSRSNIYQWLGGLSFKARFSADSGAVLYTGDAAQSSGVSTVDFSAGSVVYTAVSADGILRQNYSVILRSPQFTGLPIVRVETEDGNTINSRDVYQKARIGIFDPSNAKNNLSLPSTGSYPDEIRGRGNTTWQPVSGGSDYDKKNPYRIKFASKKSLFGLTSAKSWVLLANKNDPTLMMNAVSFEAGRRIGLEFCNHAVPVELFVNGRYMGGYLLTEQIQVNKGRVDISETGGFLLSMDTYNFTSGYADADPRFRSTGYSLPMMFKSPEIDGLTAPLDVDSTHPLYGGFITVFNAFSSALYNNNAASPSSNYHAMIDMDNFINFIMLNEMVRNTEVQHPKSMYFYRDAGSGAKIKMGPPWDFDWAFGGNSLDYFHETTSEGTTIPRILLYPNGKGPVPYQNHSSVLPSSDGFKYFRRFFSDNVFTAAYQQRWTINKTKFAEIPAFIDEASAAIRLSHEENHRRWGTTITSGTTGGTFDAQMANMKSWWTARINYLDGQISGW